MEEKLKNDHEMDETIVNREMSVDVQFMKSVSKNSLDEETISDLRPPFGSRKWLICICIVISGMTFNGTVFGYSSPAIPSLMKNHSKQEGGTHFDRLFPNDLALTDSEASWMSSISQLGFPVGGLLSGLLMGFMGKRLTGLFGHALSYILGYSLIAFASSVECLYAGRFFCGICQGFCNCLTIVYTLELCHTTKQRAVCGVLLSVMGNLGTLLTYVVGIFVNWRQLAVILMFPSLPYIVGLVAVLPDDSKKCILGRHLRLAKDSMSTTKEYLDDNDDESQILRVNTGEYQIYKNQEQQKAKLQWNNKIPMINTSVVRPLAIGCVFMFFYQFAGYNVVSYYAASILQRDEEELFSNVTDIVAAKSATFYGLDMALVSAVAIAVAGLVGVLIGVVLVHRSFNRKRILLLSAVGTAVAFDALSIYFLMGLSAKSDWLWLATVCLIVHLLLFNLGYGCIGFPMMAEILPPNFRARGLTIIMVLGGLFGFANAKSFADMNIVWGTGITFIIYGIVNLCGASFLLLFLPNI